MTTQTSATALTNAEILSIADTVEMPYTIGKPEDEDLYLTWPDRVIAFARALLAQVPATSNELASALNDFIELHDKMMEQINHKASFYDADCLQAMNTVPIRAKRLLATIAANASYANERDAATSAATPPQFTERDLSVLRFALHMFASNAHLHLDAAAQDKRGHYKKGAVEAFYRDAQDAERLMQTLEQSATTVAQPMPKPIGVSRDAESPGEKSILVSFARRLSDDEFRAVHDLLNGAVAQPSSAVDQECGLSWDGKHVRGDKVSIDAIRVAIHEAGTVPALKDHLRSLQERLATAGKVSQVAQPVAKMPEELKESIRDFRHCNTRELPAHMGLIERVYLSTLVPAAAQPVDAPALRIDLEEEEAAKLASYISSSPREITLAVLDGHAGYGLYAFDTDYLDEGCEFITAIAAAQPETPTPSEPQNFEFEAWFDREYPQDERGFRPKYRETNVMTLMRAAWAAAAQPKEVKQ